MALIESIHFQNFKVLRDATLPLSRCTVLIGANGSGKSTVFQGLKGYRDPDIFANSQRRCLTIGISRQDIAKIELHFSPGESKTRVSWVKWRGGIDPETSSPYEPLVFKVYSLIAQEIAAPVPLAPHMQLNETGGQLAGVLDRIRDEQPEKFEQLNDELGRWFPEFDRILFSTPDQGQRAFLLRTRRGKHAIPATDLSQGTLLALVILTLAYVPEQPSLVCIEEPDRGIHPRLLVDIRDALYRLSHPESVGEDRPPVQVITTTHSPYFLDLFRDHPEDIVIAQKTEEGARFERLSDRPDIDEILGSAPLGEVWFSGILGGVPVDQP
ncbi:MAG: ATPase [Nitrospirae bacterium]|nr:MAG: ATPase [Nitrospirota bacterium]